jgi:hypothetical protein
MSYLGQVELKSSEIRRIDVTGSTSATHTLTWTPPSEQSLIITINGIKQQNNYSFSGTTLTLDTALITTDAMEVVGILDIGEAVTPPDDSISTIKIQDDAVTAAKLASGLANATHTGDVTGATALTIATDAVDIAMLSATGTADGTTFLRGDNAWASAAAGLNSVQVFTSGGTWTRPASITKVIVHVVGAGGAGGGGRSGYNYTGTGGGASGLAIKFLDVSSISTSTITIAAAITGAAIDASGADGGDSSWADGTNTIAGNGGDGGNYGGESYSEPGGTASGGDINSTGGSGMAGPAPNTDAHGGGPGGICCHGFGGSGGAMVRGNWDNDAKGYGHGGGGGAKNCTGGASAPGIIVVWEYK